MIERRKFYLSKVFSFTKIPINISDYKNLATGGGLLSATNRGSVRSESDFYATPTNTINKFLDNYKIRQGNILEPCAGNGNIIKALRER